MRSLLLIPMLLLPLTACMTQRDKSVWQEFKAELSSSKADEAEKKVEAAPAEPAADAAVTESGVGADANGSDAKASDPNADAPKTDESSEAVQVPEK